MNHLNISDTAAAIEAGAASTQAAPRLIYVAHPADKSVAVPLAIEVNGTTTSLELLDSALAEIDKRYAARPRAGTAALTEVDSFIAYLGRWGSPSTVVYADTAALSLTAVLDDHPADERTTATRIHRATYSCPRSPEWLAWSALDGKPQTQTQFADFVESRLEDMINVPDMPRPTDVLTMARNLSVVTKGEYRRDFNPTNGDSILVVKSEADATKSTPIPRAFMIAVRVFDGESVLHQVEARVRFALIDGRPTFTLQLHRRAEIERDAFGAVRTKVGEDTGRLVLAGTP